MDILTLLEESQEDIAAVVSNPLAQQGPPAKPYLGLQLMPERPVDQNQFAETRISYKTQIANNGTRYSPVQIKGGLMVGSFDVKTESSDIGAQLLAQDYDAIMKLVRAVTGRAVPMTAMMALLKWVDKQLVLPLVEKNELSVWQCVVDAIVMVTGDDGYSKPVPIPNPPGQRVASGDWSDPTYDPMIDIYGRADFLADKGYSVKRQIAPRTKVTQLLNHPLITKAARGFITVENGALVGSENRLTLKGFNAFLDENDLPPVEVYNKKYNTQTGNEFFLKRDVWVMVAETDQQEEVQIEDGDPLVIENTIGYTAVGVNAGYSNPGRMIETTPYGGKAPHVDGQAWQESFPVNQNPEAVTVLTDIPDND